MATKREVLEAALRGEGALGKAADDEQVFVLRAQDLLAPGCVESWAVVAKQFGCPVAKVRDAQSTAEQMHKYPNRKYPD